MLHRLMFLVCLLACGRSDYHFLASAYRMGDAVDTDVSMDGFLWDALRSQMPKFGINTKVHFDMEIPDDRRKYRTFTLLFEDGLRSIETRPFHNWRQETLERVVVKFVYSKSGKGMIHSVSSTGIYKASPASPGRFRVEYEWQEEEAVRLNVGSCVMFLAVFLSSIVFLFQTCGLDDEDGDSDEVPSDAYGGPLSMSAYSDHKRW